MAHNLTIQMEQYSNKIKDGKNFTGCCVCRGCGLIEQSELVGLNSLLMHDFEVFVCGRKAHQAVEAWNATTQRKLTDKIFCTFFIGLLY